MKVETFRRGGQPTAILLFSYRIATGNGSFSGSPSTARPPSPSSSLRKMRPNRQKRESSIRRSRVSARMAHGSSTPFGRGEADLRVPITGGSPQSVLTASSGIIDSFRCARFPATSCVIAERTQDKKQLVFTAFDPATGRGLELKRFATTTTPDAEYAWDLSPDGTRLAILRRSEATIRVLWLNQETSDSVGKKLSNLETVDWTADGKALLVSSVREGGSALLQLDLKGNGHLLWESNGTVEPSITAFVGGPSAPWAIPSRDGRHLAICVWSLNANMWMMENF
jgi:WD40-like Beta Propeller Repeat